MKPLYHCSCMYELVLEAVDAAGVLNLYLAYVKIDDINEGMWLEEFHIFRDNGYPSRLYHYLGNSIFISLFVHGAWCCIILIVIDRFICLKQTTSLLNDA